MPSISDGALRRLLRQHGCVLRREGRKHEVWHSPITNQSFTVPRKLKGEGTLQKILKESGVKQVSGR